MGLTAGAWCRRGQTPPYGLTACLGIGTAGWRGEKPPCAKGKIPHWGLWWQRPHVLMMSSSLSPSRGSAVLVTCSNLGSLLSAMQAPPQVPAVLCARWLCHHLVTNKGGKELWEPSCTLGPFQAVSDAMQIGGGSSSWLQHGASACCQISVIAH